MNIKNKINSYIKINVFTQIALVIIFSTSCTKKKNTVPYIQNVNVSSITSQSFVIDGVINNPDGFDINSYGVVYGINPINNLTDGALVAEYGYDTSINFRYQIRNLLPNTKYYVRPYNSDIFGNIFFSKELTFTTPSSENTPFNSEKSYGSVTDIEGNVYKTVQIGTQTWMAENLKSSKFNNDTLISQIIESTSFNNFNNPAWCYYDDNVQNNNKYGKLYNIHVVTSNYNVCPTGWHIPTFTDYLTLKSSVNSDVGSLKSTGYSFWNSPNPEATNESGMSLSGSGQREETNFVGIKEVFVMWINENNYYFVIGNTAGEYLGTGLNTMSSATGLSIRCLKD